MVRTKRALKWNTWSRTLIWGYDRIIWGVYVYIYIYTCIYEFTYVYIYICIYVYIYIYIAHIPYVGGYDRMWYIAPSLWTVWSLRSLHHMPMSI